MDDECLHKLRRMPKSTENVVNCAIWHWSPAGQTKMPAAFFFAVSNFQAVLTV